MLMHVVHTLQDAKDTLVLFANTDLKVYRSEHLATDTLVDLDKLFALNNFKGNAGQVAVYFRVAGLEKFDRVIVVGLGKCAPYTSVATLKKAVGSLVSTLTEVKPDSLTVLCPTALFEGADGLYRTAAVMVEALNYARYQFKKFLTLDKKDGAQHSSDCSCCTAVKNYHFVVAEAEAAEFERGVVVARAISAGVKLARDLGNLPANICTPYYLSEVGTKLAADYEAVSVEVVDEHQMKELGMGCYLAVAQGTVNRPYMTVLKYSGAADQNQRPFVFVGKGMTFDSGGYSIKPAASMEEMIYDMCGGASALGLIKTVAELKLPINVVGVVAGCENLVDAAGYRPGDIVKSMKGLSVEIINTDAEGRLVLCDALTYVERFNPATVINIATLTGACMVALGNRITGVFANDDELAGELVAAGDYVGDAGWHMPVDDDFRDDMRGHHSDLINSGGRFGGASTAAAYLSYFTEDYRWAHLDIAGTAWVSGKKHNATGRPVSLMTQWLMNQVK